MNSPMSSAAIHSLQRIRDAVSRF